MTQTSDPLLPPPALVRLGLPTVYMGRRRYIDFMTGDVYEISDMAAVQHASETLARTGLTALSNADWEQWIRTHGRHIPSSEFHIEETLT